MTRAWRTWRVGLPTRGLENKTRQILNGSASGVPGKVKGPQRVARKHPKVTTEDRTMSESKGERGKKVCPKCGASVGVRTQACECGHVCQFKGQAAPAPAKTSPAKPAKKPARKPAPVSLASQITDTLALVGEVRDLASLAGGPEAVATLLVRIEGLAGKVGGIDALRGILATVVPVPVKPEPAPVAVQPAPVPVVVEPAPAKKPARKKADKPAPEPVQAEQPPAPVEAAQEPAPAKVEAA